MITDEKVLQIVSPILRKALGPLGLDSLSVSSGTDHDGDQVLYALVRYRPNAPKPDGRIFLDAMVEAMRRLSENGEERFLHVRHEYVDGEPALDDEPKPSARRRRA
jgi:hypothetical protein